MKITKENKIKQNIAIELDSESEERTSFIDHIMQWVETNTKQTIEGKVERINVDSPTWSSRITINIITMKEDKLTQIAYDGDKTIDAKSDSDA